MTHWRVQSKCSSLPLQLSEALFFPTSGRRKNAAIEYCNSGCPVLNECLEFALDQEITFGIWGGTTAKDRQAIVAFRAELNGAVVKNPRSNKPKPKRSGFTIT